jgi:hypothetical protein
MQEVKTVDLAGPALDWAIAQIEGVEVAIAAPQYGTGWRVYKPNFGGKYSPSTDWAVAGPLIEKHQVNLHIPQHSDDCWAAWVTIDSKDYAQGGYQVLVAVCRAIVAAKWGNTVHAPKELILTKQLGERSSACRVEDQLHQPSIMPSSLEA